MLGLCYSGGIGTKECKEKAKFWYQKSANGGNEFGCLTWELSIRRREI